jgi:transketolase
MAEQMRERMIETVSDVLARDERVALLLADISASQFGDVLRRYPRRALNVGIMEQTLIGVAAGFALEGFIPVAHSITPFLVERPYEQLKDDFCYQRLGGNFISIGASYDYSTEGMTHHGAGDVNALRGLPGMQIAAPGTAAELDALFREAYGNGSPTYFRLAAAENPVSAPVRFGQAEVLRRGDGPAVVAFGPLLGAALAATEGLDVSLLYYTTAAPFDGEALRAVAGSGEVLMVEPWYERSLAADVVAALAPRPVRLESVGVPREVLTHYGTPEQHDEALGLTPGGIRARLERFMRGG